MRVLYKCRCMEADAPVEVPERLPSLGVVVWVEQVVGGAIARDHAARSPRCQRRIMEHVKIPNNNDPRGIGFGP